MKELKYLEKFENLWCSFVKNKVIKKGNTLSLYIDFEEFNVVIKARVGKKGSIKVFVFVFYKDKKEPDIKRVFICKEFYGVYSDFFNVGFAEGGDTELCGKASNVGKLIPKSKNQQESLKYINDYLEFLILTLSKRPASFRSYLNTINFSV